MLVVCRAGVAVGLGGADEEKPKPRMKEWEQEVRNKIAKDEKLKALAAKHPLVLLHARYPYADAGCTADKLPSASIMKPPTQKGTGEDVQFLWGNGGIENTITTNVWVGQQNLVVDLGKVDFEKDPEPGRISIDHPGLGRIAFASEGLNVYLERVPGHEREQLLRPVPGGHRGW